MAQGRSTKIISMIKWFRTSRLSIKNSFSGVLTAGLAGVFCSEAEAEESKGEAASV